MSALYVEPGYWQPGYAEGDAAYDGAGVVRRFAYRGKPELVEEVVKRLTQKKKRKRPTKEQVREAVRDIVFNGGILAQSLPDPEPVIEAILSPIELEGGSDAAILRLAVSDYLERARRAKDEEEALTVLLLAA